MKKDEYARKVDRRFEGPPWYERFFPKRKERVETKVREQPRALETIAQLERDLKKMRAAYEKAVADFEALKKQGLNRGMLGDFQKHALIKDPTHRRHTIAIYMTDWELADPAASGIFSTRAAEAFREATIQVGSKR